MTTQAGLHFDAAAILMAPPDITNSRLRVAKRLPQAHILTVEQANRGLQRVIDELRQDYEPLTDEPIEVFHGLVSCDVGGVGYEISADIVGSSAADFGAAMLDGLLGLARDFAIELGDDDSTQQRREVIAQIGRHQMDLPDGEQFYTYDEMATLSLVQLKHHLNQLSQPTRT